MDIVQDGFKFFRHDITEAAYEQVVADLFKRFAGDDWHISFEKVYLETAGRQVCPDGYLVRSDLSRVFFVEVEIEGHHSFEDHILPQLISYGNTNFTEKSADLLASKWPTPVPAGLATALMRVPAEVLLISTGVPVAWHRQLSTHGTHWMEVGPMRAEVGRPIRVLEGFFEFLLTHTNNPDVRLEPSEMHGYPVMNAATGWPILRDRKEVTLIIDGRETTWTPQIEEDMGFLMGPAKVVSELEAARQILVGSFVTPDHVICIREVLQ